MSEYEMGLEHLELWKVAIAFAQTISLQVIPLLPPDEKWVMSTQLRRCAQSIPANIAEGYGRYYYQENVRFCYIARGSLEETFSHLTLALRFGYLCDELYAMLVVDVNRLRRLLNGYIAYLKTSKRGASEPGASLSVREDLVDYQLDETAEPVYESPAANH